MNITVIGSGYVGLITAACFASRGNTVTCIDTDADKVKSLKNTQKSIKNRNETSNINLYTRRISYIYNKSYK